MPKKSNPKRARRYARGPRGGYSAAERASLPSGDFLKPETRTWPVSDLRHAEIALDYMARGFGSPREYPMLLERLFARYHPEDYPSLAAKYRRLESSIAARIEGRRARANPVARKNWANFAIQAALTLLPTVVAGFKQLGARKLAAYEKLVAADDVPGQLAFIRKHSWINPGLRAVLANDEAAEWLRVRLNEALAEGAGEAALTAAGTAADLGVLAAQAKAGQKAAAKLNPRRRAGLYMIYSIPRHGLQELHALVADTSRNVYGQQVLRIDWPATAHQVLGAYARVRPRDPIFYGMNQEGKRVELKLKDVKRLSSMRPTRGARQVLRFNPAASWQHASKYWPAGYDGTDPEKNRQIVSQWLKSAPSDWRAQFRAGMKDRVATGQRGGGAFTLDNALKILGITAGGNRSRDAALGRNSVPPAVRADAMKGLALSWTHNYGGWNFIGVARAIQLAVMPGVPDETKRRMANFFGRNQRWKDARHFGDDDNPSRGYMAWLNWGGVAAEEWL